MSALNATTFSSTRVSFAMGRDRNLPDAFASIHPTRRTPVIALLGSGAIILLMAVAVPIEHVAAAADIMFLLLFLQVNIAVIVIRKKYSDKLRYGYIMPFFPIVPIIGIITKLALAVFMFHYSPLAWYITLGWLGIGFALYVWYAKPREREKVTTPVLVGEMLPRTKERFRVLVPIANPATAKPLLAFAARVAQIEDGEVVVLHTINIPHQVPLQVGRQFVHLARPIIDMAMQFLDTKHIKSSALVRLSHRNVWQSIIDTIEEYSVDFVVMGWRGHSSDPTSQVGKNLDEVLKKANCNAVIIQDPFENFVNRILVPVAHPSHIGLMVQVAGLLALRGGNIDVLFIVPPGQLGSNETNEILQNLNDSMKENINSGDGLKISIKCVEASSPINEIVRRSNDYETVVLGAAREKWISRKLRGDWPHQIARRVECPIVLVSQKTGTLKFGVQKFIEFFRDLESEVEKEVQVLDSTKQNPPHNDTAQ